MMISSLFDIADFSHFNALENIAGIDCTYVSSLKHIFGFKQIKPLLFHKMGEWKWKKYELPYRLSETWEPGAEELEQFTGIFKAEGLHVE